MRGTHWIAPASLFLLSALAAYALPAAAAEAIPELRTVPYVDLERYMGRWYEIARFPHRFERGCTGSMATYSLRDDGKVAVTNTCRVSSLEGDVRQVQGLAWVVDPSTNAKLRVRFFWPFSGDYWIIDLGKDYEYAVVGHPDRDHLWILSRTPSLDSAVYAGILGRLVEQGYDVSRLIRTVQHL